MKLINYNPETGDFKLSINENLTERELNWLRIIRDEKSITRDSLYQKRNDSDTQEAFDENMEKIHLLSNLEDWFLIEKIIVWTECKIDDWAYGLTDMGKSLLNIVDNKQKNKKV